jgi:hypothetical protein
MVDRHAPATMTRTGAMDWFVTTFWVAMILGLSAVVVPAYWLVSAWWQDRERNETLTAQPPVSIDPM